MNNSIKKGIVVSVILLFVSVSVIPSTGTIDIEQITMPSSSGNNTLYVGGSGPGNYTKIQDAINDSSDEDTVFVYNDSSPYYEHVVVNKSINLIGEDKNTTVIDGNEIGNCVNVSAECVTISGFTIQNSKDERDNAGIYIVSNNTIISNNIIGNTISFNDESGIYLRFSNGNIITNNTISNNDDGIHLALSYNNLIQGNFISNNDGKGIDLVYSHYNTISDNTVTLNGHSGINLWDSNNNNITANILLYNSIILITSNITTITSNTISNNMRSGILLHASNNNTIYHNNFINNTQNVNDTDNKNNTWDNGYPSCGNYWDDYDGIDNNWGENQNINGSDGIGDTPYNIFGEDNQDRYPLIEPYGMTKLTFSMGPGLGLFKFSGIIKNIGNKTAFNVQWKITIDGGFIIVGRHSSGTLPKPLLPSEETSVTSKLVLGFGRIMITIAVWADNAPLISESIPGTLFLIFLML